jgi:xanthine dehydrogenase accessory factor
VRELGRLHSARVPAVILMRTSGAAPDHLIVSADSTTGTLGDGECDARATALGREMLAKSVAEPRLVALDGEGTTVFAEVVRPSEFNVVLFGAGHVGRAIAHVLGGVPARVTWADSRAGEFPDNPPANIRVVITDDPAAEVDAAPPGSWFLVMTHSHDLDFDLVERILRRGDFAYCGMIGSATKRRSFEKRLESRGVDRRLLERLTCPIGIAGITGKAPGVIAVAVAAELLALRERATADAVPRSAHAG